MESQNFNVLLEKWSQVLDHPKYRKIEDHNRRVATALVFENTEKMLGNIGTSSFLTEAAPANNQGGGAVATFDPVLIGLLRRSMPNLMAYDICGVQAMTGPNGIIFAMRSKYTSQAGAEALFNEADTDFSGTGSHAASSPFDGGFATGNGFTTSAVEALATPSEMALTIDKVNVNARTRFLKAEFSHELAQDLKSIHNLDAEAELATMLSSEILAEINRETVRTLYYIAQTGAQKNTAVAGTFNLAVDSNGRHMEETFKGLLFFADREANEIARKTRRGKGNIIICSSDVASALATSGMLSYAPALSTNLTVDDTGNTFAGVLNNQFRVYIDPYFSDSAGNELLMVGYKGAHPFDAGFFYCPYVPLQMMRATGQDNFVPRIAFKTRYGLVSNPFYTNSTGDITPTSNPFYRLTKVTNLL